MENKIEQIIEKALRDSTPRLTEDGYKLSAKRIAEALNSIKPPSSDVTIKVTGIYSNLVEIKNPTNENEVFRIPEWLISELKKRSCYLQGEINEELMSIVKDACDGKLSASIAYDRIEDILFQGTEVTDELLKKQAEKILTKKILSLSEEAIKLWGNYDNRIIRDKIVNAMLEFHSSLQSAGKGEITWMKKNINNAKQWLEGSPNVVAALICLDNAFDYPYRKEPYMEGAVEFELFYDWITNNKWSKNQEGKWGNWTLGIKYKLTFTELYQEFKVKNNE